ncbi:MAG TPA: DUF2752 domain-containing protein [Edaphobacter sp.]|nr:DUF2752 domain-containing protein [Edaphobacter sp.]
MIPAGRNRIATLARAVAPPALLALTVGLLRRFPPEQYSFYPRCPLYLSLHLQCPGCGTTRAFAALLRGHFTEALHLNALTTLLLPLGVIYAALCYRRLLRSEDLRWPQLPSAGIYATLAVAAIFTVARNLPGQSW